MGNRHQKPNQKNADQCIAYAIKHGLYEIVPINKTLDKRTLSMAYSPGVGAACMAIKDKPEMVDELTFRGRSVAIVTQGNYDKSQHFEPGHMVPILDWCIAQAKFYGGVDCYPFILRKEANIQNVLNDLSNSYSVIVWLDHSEVEIDKIPKDVAFIHLQKACHMIKSKKVEWQRFSSVLSYMTEKNIRGGLVSQAKLAEGFEHHPNLFKRSSEYFTVFHDGRSLNEHALEMHKYFEGKIQLELNFINIQKVKHYFTEQNLIHYIKNGNPQKGYKKLSAIVTDGTAILGFGDIGPRAGLPVMEGKSMLFKSLGGTNVVPVCINKRSTAQEEIQAILDIASYFKAINLEDIKAPQCFQIQKELSDRRILPIFHDDQHGTAIITLAALINACKVAKKETSQIKVVINGAGAAGMTIAKLLLSYGIKKMIIADTKGAIYEGREQNMNAEKIEIAKMTNSERLQGPLEGLIKGADVFIGVSVAGAFKKSWVNEMAPKPIIFAMANPNPEINLEDALAGGAFIYGSGRSDYQNQINNSLVFPGIFRALHLHNLPRITMQMKLAVAELIAESVSGQLNQTNIIPDSLDRDVPAMVTQGLEKYKPKE